MLKERPWNFYHVGLGRRYERKCHGPKMQMNKGKVSVKVGKALSYQAA
jgi:hypothetical protein